MHPIHNVAVSFICGEKAPAIHSWEELFAPEVLKWMCTHSLFFAAAILGMFTLEAILETRGDASCAHFNGLLFGHLSLLVYLLSDLEWNLIRPSKIEDYLQTTTAKKVS